jgi:hypothetical protein
MYPAKQQVGPGGQRPSPQAVGPSDPPFPEAAPSGAGSALVTVLERDTFSGLGVHHPDLRVNLWAGGRVECVSLPPSLPDFGTHSPREEGRSYL